MLGFGPRLHVFTAGSQDVNNRFVASQLLYGSPLALPVPDVLRTDLLVVIGANPVVSHGSVLTVPRIKDRMHDIVKRGGRVLVVDPRKTETAAQFEWLGIVPDGDAYLLLSLLHVMFGENLVDRSRLARQADGGVWLEQLARPFSPRLRRRARGSTRRRCEHLPATWCAPSVPRCTDESGPASAKTARSQHICSTRSTLWPAISMWRAAACSVASDFPASAGWARQAVRCCGRSTPAGVHASATSRRCSDPSLPA